MQDHGGFDHNEQSLRWVEMLEEKYPAFPGLNLTWEVRAGLRKHSAARPGAELDGQPIGPFQSGEAQIADVADDISYYAMMSKMGWKLDFSPPAFWKRATYGTLPAARSARCSARWVKSRKCV